MAQLCFKAQVVTVVVMVVMCVETAVVSAKKHGRFAHERCLLLLSFLLLCLLLLPQAQAEWDEKEKERLEVLASVTNKASRKRQLEQQEQEQQFVAYVPLPDQKAIEQLVLQRKKQELLSKYTSEALAKQQEEAKNLLNKQ